MIDIELGNMASSKYKPEASILGSPSLFQILKKLIFTATLLKNRSTELT
jgi:hypothetical protein